VLTCFVTSVAQVATGARAVVLPGTAASVQTPARGTHVWWKSCGSSYFLAKHVSHMIV